MTWSRRHLTDIGSFSREDFEYVFRITDKLLPNSGIDKTRPLKPSFLAQSRIMTLWFEPEYEKSTRTFGSFQGAMMRLGGQWKEFNESESSIGKGESVEDTVRILSQHSFYIIWKKRNSLDGLTVALVGDLKNGRTVHSLCRGSDAFEGMKLYGLYPEGCELPKPFECRGYEGHTIGMNDLNFKLSEMEPDVLYVTRSQLERGTEAHYVIDKSTLAALPPHALIMHPMPRDSKHGPEIAYEVDGDSRAAYFEQAAYGVPTRMALISVMLDLDGHILRG